MKKEYAYLLKKRAEEVATMYSNPQRTNNYGGETFKVDKIIPLGSRSACVIYLKSSGKKAMAYFVWIENAEFWNYFFVGIGHLIGLYRLQGLLQEVEEFNFEKNFDEKPVPLAELV